VGSQVVSYIKKKGKYDCKLASVMTDFASHNQWLIGHEQIDYIFVSNEPMREDIISKGVDPSKIFATGIPLSNRFLQHFDREEIKKSFDLDLKKHTILFFGGGEFGLGKDKTLLLLEYFIKSLNDTYQMVAIAGKNRKMEKSFRELVRNLNAQDKVQVYGYTNEVPELMSISALVVTKPGGLTTTESLASGLPMLIINPIPGQEVQNALFLEEQGVAVWIKNEADSEIVIRNILNNPEEIKHMKIRAKLLAKKNSTKDICEIILRK
jgi:processive 1,2-diacylglycerol beta-glucosyltransferase